jgi:hypothetical protein
MDENAAQLGVSVGTVFQAAQELSKIPRKKTAGKRLILRLW